MFKGHPKGLYVLALANTGERFGYYTMLAIFVLFLQASFGFSSATSSQIYAGFLALVYFLPLIGGILADKFGYGRMISIGIVIMFIGYIFLAIPMGTGTLGIVAMVGALFLISLGTGFFKGNLQVLVGNLYDDPKYSSRRDTAFSLFYMAINIGALFAPTAASYVTDKFLGKAGLHYVSSIPTYAHQLLDGTIQPTDLQAFQNLAQQQAGFTGNLNQFSTFYIDKLSHAYHWGFAVACISLIISMLIYWGFKKAYKYADVNSKQAAQNKDLKTNVKVEELSPTQTRQRITALMLVFAVVIFFWMAFHQNGLTLTFFARDYTAHSVNGPLQMAFNVWNLVLIIIAVYSTFSIFQSTEKKNKIISAGITVVALGFLIFKFFHLDRQPLDILPQIFQQFNPFFVVALTPVSLAIFGTLAKKGKEPSAPRKIGIGMFIAAIGYLLMMNVSYGLPQPNMGSATIVPDNLLVSPGWLISTYLILTFAELFLSPMGISFVSKVAPPKYKGAMMGLWFVATAIGNYLVSIIGVLWGRIPLWSLWTILIVLCTLSGIFIFSVMKKLENATK